MDSWGLGGGGRGGGGQVWGYLPQGWLGLRANLKTQKKTDKSVFGVSTLLIKCLEICGPCTKHFDDKNSYQKNEMEIK